MSTTAERLVPTDAPGSVSRAYQLPAGFRDTFASYLVGTGRVRLHAVAGGDGLPLLLVPGWPQNWFAWRHLMPALARRFAVVVADPRGVNLSDRATAGYDTASLADDLVALMEVLGHSRFAVIGHDVGVWIGYALAADHPQRLARLAVAEAAIPGIFHYVEALTRDRQALHCTFEVYRAIEHTVEQNTRRQNYRLQLPVLAIGGADASDEGVAKTMWLIADDVTPVVLERCGHYVADEAPEGMLAGLEPFLAPYEAGK
jgi:pimeloyl-ACP methyl ester carboxylesterase